MLQKNLTIFGDFNYPEIDWDNLYCNKNEEHCASIFLHQIISNNLVQKVKEPTHFKPNCKPSLIDLVLTKIPNSIGNIAHHPPLSMSHHHVLIITKKTIQTMLL